MPAPWDAFRSITSWDMVQTRGYLFTPWDQIITKVRQRCLQFLCERGHLPDDIAYVD